MKSKMRMIFLLAIVTLLGTACRNSKKDKEVSLKDSTKTEQQTGNTDKSADFSGIYKTDDAKGCAFSIELKKDGKSYHFAFKGEGIDNSGKAFIDPVDGKDYISFDSRIGSNEAGTISGEIQAGAIMIQNYGNSINEYHFFKMCDSKYLEFKKQ